MLQTLFIYLLKVVVCSAILLSYYWFALRNKRFHHYNRFYLLLSVVLSIALPLLNLQLFIFRSDSANVNHLLNVIYTSGESSIVIKGNTGFNWREFLLAAFAAVTICSLLLLVSRILNLYKLKKIYPVNKMSGFDFINTDLQQAPFSFLKNIFWRSNLSLEEPTGQQIFQHELTHIKQKHTLDKLFVQIVLSFFWMNPFYWLIRSELYFIHEFIADEKAVTNKDASAFAVMLLQAQYGKTIFSPAQSFFYSPIKRRLLMLTTSKQPRFSYARRIIAMPLLAFVILLSAFKLQKSSELNTTRNDEPVKSARVISSNADTSILKGDVNDSILYVLDGKIVNASELGKLGPDKIHSISVLKDDAAIKKYGEKGKYGVIEITTKEKADPKSKSVLLVDTTPQYKTVFTQVQQEAQFPGGNDAWRKYLEENLNTKVLVDKKAPDGDYTVVVTFLVDDKGIVSEVKALNDPGYGAADEAVRVIANSGKWIPATQNGKLVTYRQKQAITFRIDETKKPVTLNSSSVSEDTDFVKASFPGGHYAWQKFLEDNLNANIPVDKGSPSGTYKVVVSFLVDATGKVSQVKAVNDPGYGTAGEAVRLIANGPNWVPAKKKNSPVSSMVKQDITFQVSEQ